MDADAVDDDCRKGDRVFLGPRRGMLPYTGDLSGMHY